MNKRYACADIHGFWELWSKIKNYCDESDIIYFLGDACDRGPDGIKIIQDMMKDKRVHFLKGNHEDFIDKYYDMNFEHNPTDIHVIKAFNDYWLSNGGNLTQKAFNQLSEKEQKEIIEYIRNMPLFITLTNRKGKKIFLSHAGPDPNYIKQKQELLLINDPNILLWDRSHFLMTRGEYEEYIIHGHTPCCYIRESLNDYSINQKDPAFENTIYIYENGHKIDLDLCSVSTKRIALFDLDEFTVKYFEME